VCLVDNQDNDSGMALGLGGFGLVFFAVGAYVLWGSLSSKPAATISTVEAASVAQQPVGAEVIVEGRLSATALVRGQLAIALEQEAVGETKPGSNAVRMTWKTVSVLAQPFEVEDATGRARVRSAGDDWRDPPRQEPEALGVVTAGTKRSIGFARGDVVTVRGVVVEGGQLDAKELFGGSAEAYANAKKASALVPTILGGVFALAGLGALFAGLRMFRRG
jgi:hypothetical protein